MTPATVAPVRALIVAHLREALPEYNLAQEDIPGHLDMRASGLLDSLGFMQLIAMLEYHLDFQIDLQDLDADLLTVVGPLSEHVARQWSARKDAPEVGAE